MQTGLRREIGSEFVYFFFSLNVSVPELKSIIRWWGMGGRRGGGGGGGGGERERERERERESRTRKL